MQHLAQSDLRGRFADLVGAVVAEPTELHIVDAHKGAVRWDLLTSGRSCHSSRPELGINAIYQHGRASCRRRALRRGLRTSRSDPLLGPPTLSVGRIEGGTSVNTVPDRCRIEIDRRRCSPARKGADGSGAFADCLRRTVRPSRPYSFSEPWLSSPAAGSGGSADLVS